MNRQNIIPVAVLTGFLLFTLFDTGVATAQETPASTEMILLSVETFATAADGETRSTGHTTLTLIKGQSKAASISCGSFDRNGGIGSQFTMGGVGQLDPDDGMPFTDLPDWCPTVWGIRCSLVGWDAGEITVQVDWERVRQKKPGTAVRERTGHRLITFTEEGRHLLDFIGTPDGEPDAAGLVNRTVELEARVAERPSLAARTIQYDLWLVDEAADGKQISRPLRLVGRQGQRLEFSFETIRWPVPGIELENGRGIETLMEIEGDIRGRIRPDGSIEISLSSGRRFGLAEAGKDWKGWSGNGRGKKYFTVAPGETVSTLYPEPGGQSILYRQSESRPATRGVTVTDEFIKVQFRPFFEGHAISLVLSATTVP